MGLDEHSTEREGLGWKDCQRTEQKDKGLVHFKKEKKDFRKFEWGIFWNGFRVFIAEKSYCDVGNERILVRKKISKLLLFILK